MYEKFLGLTRRPVNGAMQSLRRARIFSAIPVSAQTASMVALIALVLSFLDEPLYRYVRTLDPSVIHFADRLTHSGDAKWPLLVLGAMLAVAFAVRARIRREAVVAASARVINGCLFIIASILLTGVLVNIVKPLFGRARPKLFEQFGPDAFVPFSFGYDFGSFPSGHATTFFAMAVAIAFLAPRAATLLLVLAALFSGSRVVVGSHYLSDVIAGACLSLLAVAWLRQWLAERGALFEAAADGRLRLSARLIRLRRSGARNRQPDDGRES